MGEMNLLEVGTGTEARKIAVRHRPATTDGATGVAWLGGYRSDMMGTKAMALDEWAQSTGHACLRHDYSGHGESGGDFMEGTISRWVEESMAVFDAYAKTPYILVGSSMGAWVALRMVQELLARGESDRLKGLLLLAPAPDFTHELMLPKLGAEQRKLIEEKGYLEEPSEYSDEPNIFTRGLFEDGEKNRVMTGFIDVPCPVRIIQGMQDPDVPHEHASKLATMMPQVNLTMTMIPDGDHRLSRPQDIELIIDAVSALAAGGH